MHRWTAPWGWLGGETFVPDVAIDVADGRSESHPLRIGPRGEFESEPLPPGTYHLVLPGPGLCRVAPRAIHLEPGGDLDVGELRVPALGRLDLGEGAARTVRLTLARVLEEGTRLPVFDGRVDLPATIPLGAGEWEVGLPESSGITVRATVVEGEAVRVDAP